MAEFTVELGAESEILHTAAALLRQFGWKRFGAGGGCTVLEAVDLVAGLRPDIPIAAWDGALQLLAGSVTSLVQFYASAESAIRAWEGECTSLEQVLDGLTKPVELRWPFEPGS